MTDCCNTTKNTKKKRDWLLIGSVVTIIASFVLVLFFPHLLNVQPYIRTFAESCTALLKQMAVGIALGIFFLALLTKMPRDLLISVLGRTNGLSSIIRATVAGVLLDLCSHGILMVGAKLYERGASTGQVMAFLIASPWNSLSLTIILASLIGIYWTISFVLLSLLIAIITGLIINGLEKTGTIQPNPNRITIDSNFQFWKEAKQAYSQASFNKDFFFSMFLNGVKESRIVIRWVFFGIILASLLRTFLDVSLFETLFGRSMLGLGMTLIVATVLEVCSEGSTPIAADIMTRAHAPGNSFAFLMAGVSTDYTEIMVLKDTTKSWKTAFLLPIITLPQIILIGALINVFG